MAIKKKFKVTNVTKVKQSVINIDTNMVGLANELKNLSENINAMMTGDAEGPYWNGKKARKFYNRAIENLKNNIKDYVTARNYLNALGVGFEQAVKQDN